MTPIFNTPVNISQLPIISIVDPYELNLDLSYREAKGMTMIQIEQPCRLKVARRHLGALSWIGAVGLGLLSLSSGCMTSLLTSSADKLQPPAARIAPDASLFSSPGPQAARDGAANTASSTVERSTTTRRPAPLPSDLPQIPLNRE